MTDCFEVGFVIRLSSRGAGTSSAWSSGRGAFVLVGDAVDLSAALTLLSLNTLVGGYVGYRDLFNAHAVSTAVGEVSAHSYQQSSGSVAMKSRGRLIRAAPAGMEADSLLICIPKLV